MWTSYSKKRVLVDIVPTSNVQGIQLGSKTCIIVCQTVNQTHSSGLIDCFDFILNTSRKPCLKICVSCKKTKCQYWDVLIGDCFGLDVFAADSVVSRTSLLLTVVSRTYCVCCWLLCPELIVGCIVYRTASRLFNLWFDDVFGTVVPGLYCAVGGALKSKN